MVKICVHVHVRVIKKCANARYVKKNKYSGDANVDVTVQLDRRTVNKGLICTTRQQTNRLVGLET